MPTTILPTANYKFDGLALKFRNLYYPSIVVILSILITLYPIHSHKSAELNEINTEVIVKKDITIPEAASYIKKNNSSLSDSEAEDFAKHVVTASKAFNLDVALLLALAKVESGFKPESISKAGALGLTQVIPKWHVDRIKEARKITGAYSIFEPKLNLYVGAWALRDFISETGSTVKGLLSYNGSSSDPQKTYAKLVLAEAKNVRTNFLTQ